MIEIYAIYLHLHVQIIILRHIIVIKYSFGRTWKHFDLRNLNSSVYLEHKPTFSLATVRLYRGIYLMYTCIIYYTTSSINVCWRKNPCSQRLTTVCHVYRRPLGKLCCRFSLQYDSSSSEHGQRVDVASRLFFKPTVLQYHHTVQCFTVDWNNWSAASI